MKKQPDWKGFCEYIIRENKLPPCNTFDIPFGQWFALTTRNQKQLVENAKKVLAHYDGREVK